MIVDLKMDVILNCCLLCLLVFQLKHASESPYFVPDDHEAGTLARSGLPIMSLHNYKLCLLGWLSLPPRAIYFDKTGDVIGFMTSFAY